MKAQQNVQDGQHHGRQDERNEQTGRELRQRDGCRRSIACLLHQQTDQKRPDQLPERKDDHPAAEAAEIAAAASQFCLHSFASHVPRIGPGMRPGSNSSSEPKKPVHPSVCCFTTAELTDIFNCAKANALPRAADVSEWGSEQQKRRDPLKNAKTQSTRRVDCVFVIAGARSKGSLERRLPNLCFCKLCCLPRAAEL